MLFDEQLHYVNAGFSRVGTSGTLKDNHNLDLQNIPVSKSGYLYVFCSNESSLGVYFDNLQVTHVRGPLLEESHYYPFGLSMAGLNSKALGFGGSENKKKYNDYEENRDLDLNWYESFFRVHDPQLGRFWQIDPKPKDFISLYAGMENNPIFNCDPFGDIVKGINELSASRFLDLINETFDGDKCKELRGLFKIGKDGKTFECIDKDQFLKAIEGLSDEMQFLAAGFCETINNDQEHIVEVVKRDEPISDRMKKIYEEEQKGKSGNAAIPVTGTGKDVERDGGGSNSPLGGGREGNYTIILMDPNHHIGDMYTPLKLFNLPPFYVKFGTHIAGAAETLAHELIGHGLSRLVSFGMADNNNAIRTENLYLRRHGGMVPYRDGASHDMRAVGFSQAEAQQPPEHLVEILRRIKN